MNKKHLKVGLVILNYNRGKLVHENCEIYKDYNSLDKIIIVDNKSTDNSLEILYPLTESKLSGGGKISIIESDEDGGYAKGNNLGFRTLHDEFDCDVAYLASEDVMVSDEVIIRLTKEFESHPDHAVISCTRYDPDEVKPCIQYLLKSNDTFALQLGGYLNFIRHYIILRKNAIFNVNEKQDELIDVAQVPGSFFGMNLHLCSKFGYLDEATFLYGEEENLSARIKQYGYKIGFLPSAKYQHRHLRYSTTTNEGKFKSKKYARQSKRHFQKTYLKLNVIQKGLLRIAEKIDFIESYAMKIFHK